MQSAPSVPCPQCGRSDPKPIAKQFDYPFNKGPWNSHPISTTYAYLCACGVGFTHTVKHEPPNLKP